MFSDDMLTPFQKGSDMIATEGEGNKLPTNSHKNPQVATCLINSYLYLIFTLL